MSVSDPHLERLTIEDVTADLEVGRSRPLHPATGLTTLRSVPRPTIGGPTFLAALTAAHALGRVHPRLARGPLLRLWLTPWVHPTTRRPVGDLPMGLRAWTLPAGGVTLRGYEGGSGPTVVLVHGWAGRGADWRHLAGDLVAAGWRVVAPDLPAHGATAGGTTDVFALGDAAEAVLRHERPRAVIAHSLGFPITLRALEQGVDPPEVVVALAPGRRMRHALQRFAAQARLDARLETELSRALQDRFGDDVWAVLDVDRVVPTLTPRGVVIHDRDDADVPVAHGQHIAAHWPRARLVTTEGLGHRRILRDGPVRRLVVAALG